MSSVTKELIDRLLYQEESDSLDFKEEQYKFVEAEDYEKSELLKDIIAFANSWTTSTSYILIGVREKKGEKSEVLGISNHFEDANLQEFINKKTNRPITFSYETFKYESKKIGVIEIPNQERPFYLEKDFPKLSKGKVYIRRGSSTDIASIDEISKMGIGSTSYVPKLELEIYDVNTHSTKNAFENTCFKISNGEYQKIPDFEFQTSNIIIPVGNKNFYRECYDYIAKKHLLNKIMFKITNKGKILSKNSILKFDFPSNQGIYFEIDEFYPPSRDSSLNYRNINFRNNFKDPEIELEERGNIWSILIRLGDILPKDSTFSTTFYIASNITQEIVLKTNLYSENLSEPVSVSFDLSFNTNFLDSTCTELLEMSTKID